MNIDHLYNSGNYDYKDYIVEVSKNPDSNGNFDVKIVKKGTSSSSQESYRADIVFVKTILENSVNANPNNKFYNFCLDMVNKQLEQKNVVSTIAMNTIVEPQSSPEEKEKAESEKMGKAPIDLKKNEKIEILKKLQIFNESLKTELRELWTQKEQTDVFIANLSAIVKKALAKEAEEPFREYLRGHQPYQALKRMLDFYSYISHEVELLKAIEDLTDVGPKKPIGHLGISMLEKDLAESGSDLTMFAKEMEEKGLRIKISDHIYWVYDPKALKSLLESKQDILISAKQDTAYQYANDEPWTTDPDKFIDLITKKEAKKETLLYDLIADAFGNYGGSGRKDINFEGLLPPIE